MADRPPRDLNWVPDDSTGITVPNQTKQNAGWIIEKVPLEFLNWMWNRLSRWTHYFSGQSQEYIVIDSTNANEKDYDTFEAYLADSPLVDDKVLIKETQVLTAQMIIPDGITLRLLDGVNFTRATDEVNSVIKFGSDIIIEGILNLILSQTGTIAKAIEFDGDNVVGKINVENSSTGILTAGYHINETKTGNRIDGIIENSGGGTLTNEIIDNSLEDSNHFLIFDEARGKIVRSRGAKTFQEIIFPVNWSFASQIGNDLNIAGLLFPAIAALNSTDVALFDDNTNELKTLRFDGTNWTQVGNALVIATVSSPAIAALSSTNIAFIDSTNEDLRNYGFDGTDWAQVGNDLNIAGISIPAITALSSTNIAFIDITNEDLRNYGFDGTDWAQVGNGLNIAGISVPAITALSSTNIAFIDTTNEDLRNYGFDGADWAQVGNDLNISGIGVPALTGLNGFDIVFIDNTNEDLRIIRFDGIDWAQVGNDLNISGINFSSIAAMSGNEIAFIDDSNKDMRFYRWNFSIGSPYNLG